MLDNWLNKIPHIQYWKLATVADGYELMKTML